MISPRPSIWPAALRAMHWAMALLIALQAAVGWYGQGMERSPVKIDVMTAHKSLGITLLLLALLRLCLRLRHKAPPPPQGSAAWEIRAAAWTQTLLYVLLIALPLSGWLSASTSIVPWKLWWLIPWPDIAPPGERMHEFAEGAHEILVKLLAAALAVHAAAALRHHFLKRNDVLMRMLRGVR